MIRWFTTGPGAHDIPGRQPAVTEGAWLHAKEMGTVASVCGRGAASWVKLWDVPFVPSWPQACRECARIVTWIGASQSSDITPQAPELRGGVSFRTS